MAQEPDNRATARRLAVTGMDQADAGDCASALILLEKAEALYHAPVHLQYIARCHFRLGHLVRASETYRTLAREQLTADAPPPFRAAQDEAKRELALIEPKLGTLLLQPGPPEGATIQLDGHRLPPAAIEAPLVIDPGPHKLIVRAVDGQIAETNFDVRESETLTVALGPVSGSGALRPIGRQALQPGMPSSGAVSSGAARSGAAAAGTVGGDPDAGRPWGTLGTLGIVAASVGGATVVGGLVTLGKRNADRDALLRACEDQMDHCDPRYERDKEKVETLTTATNVLVIGGAALAALGAGAWALSRTMPQKPRVSWFVLPTVGGGYLSATARWP